MECPWQTGCFVTSSLAIRLLARGISKDLGPWLGRAARDFFLFPLRLGIWICGKKGESYWLWLGGRYHSLMLFFWFSTLIPKCRHSHKKSCLDCKIASLRQPPLPPPPVAGKPCVSRNSRKQPAAVNYQGNQLSVSSWNLQAKDGYINARPKAVDSTLDNNHGSILPQSTISFLLGVLRFFLCAVTIFLTQLSHSPLGYGVTKKQRK